MARKNRSAVINEQEVNLYHITDRCVRRAFLMGDDVVTDKSFDHRRDWLRERLIQLSGIFRIDVIGYSIMGNHVHLLLRNRPDLTENLSPAAIVRDWWEISPQYRRDGEGGRLTPKRLDKLLADVELIERWRQRLSSISWFMRYLKLPLAVAANDEDNRSGHFWQARFQCKPVKSLAALLNTMIYIDLNPIRAGMARSVDDSQYTSAYDRVTAVKELRRWRRKGSRHARRQAKLRAGREDVLQLSDDWLCPIELQETSPGSGKTPTSQQANRQVARGGAQRGVLPISTEKYLMLVDIAGRIERKGKRGRISANAKPILEKLGFSTPKEWLKSYRQTAHAISRTYTRPVNTLAEANRVRLPLVDSSKSNGDCLL